MTQTGDYSIANASGSAVRGDINETLENILTTNMGASAPSYKRSGTFWVDTSVTPNVLKYYNGVGWLSIMDVNGTHIVDNGNGDFIHLGQNGTIEMCSLNGSPYFDFKRTATSGGGPNDYDCRLMQTGDTNYDFRINTGGHGTIKHTFRALGTGAVEIGDAGVGGGRTANSGSPSGGYVLGMVNAKGYAARNGVSGTNSSNMFNFSWSSPNVTSWIDGVSIGTAASTSDYRVKQNISLQTESGIDKIKLLKPSTFQYKDYEGVFKADNVTREGFIAHEIQEVIPSGATGSKDGTEIQSLKLDAIVSVLTKALQEAVAKIETLETKVAALEAK